MRTKAVQAKHIPDEAPLLVVRDLAPTSTDFWKVRPGERRWVFIWELEAHLSFPQKVVRAKLSSLIRKGLLSGCTCGCRGDFELTEEGRFHLERYT